MVARLEVVIFKRSLLATHRVSSLATFWSSCCLFHPSSHSRAPPVQDYSKWSWDSSFAIVVAAFSMGARHLRVSTADRCPNKFFSLCSKSLDGFSDRECDGPGSHTALARQIFYYLLWPSLFTFGGSTWLQNIAINLGGKRSQLT